MRKVLFALACWATVGLASSRADITYQYVAEQSSYTGAVGSTVPVNIYLQETVTGTSKSLIFAEGGLFGAGVMVLSPGGAIFGSTINGTVTNNFQIGGNTALAPAGFAFPPGNQPSQTSFVPAQKDKSGLVINGDITVAQGGGGSFNFPGGAAGVSQKALLGTVNISVLPGAAQVLTVTPYGGTGVTITQAGTDLDIGTQAINGYTGTQKNPAGNFSFTVGAVIPEPSSMALCGLVACGMGYVGYRRRKMTVSEPATVA